MDKHQAFNIGKAYKIGYNLSKRFLAQDAAEWITVHPNGKGVSLKGEDIKGRHVLIDKESGQVLGGLGGNFTGKHISEVKSKPAQAVAKPDFKAIKNELNEFLKNPEVTPLIERLDKKFSRSAMLEFAQKNNIDLSKYESFNGNKLKVGFIKEYGIENTKALLDNKDKRESSAKKAAETRKKNKAEAEAKAIEEAKKAPIPANQGRLVQPSKVIGETDKAIKAKMLLSGDVLITQWLPKSLCTVFNGFVTAIAPWYANKNNIRHYESAEQKAERERKEQERKEREKKLEEERKRKQEEQEAKTTEEKIKADRKERAEIVRQNIEKAKTDPFYEPTVIKDMLKPGALDDIDYKNMNREQFLNALKDKATEIGFEYFINSFEFSFKKDAWVIEHHPEFLDDPHYQYLKQESPDNRSRIKPAKILKETQKAVLIEHPYLSGISQYNLPIYRIGESWVPKSQAYIKDGKVLGVSEWIASQKGILTLPGRAHLKLIEQLKQYEKPQNQEKQTTATSQKTEKYPGLNEIEQAMREDLAHQERFNRSFENEEMWTQPHKSRVAELKAKYPQAAMYLKAQSYSESSNADKSHAGRKAMEMLEKGADLKEVDSVLENWLPSEKIWD